MGAPTCGLTPSSGPAPTATRSSSESSWPDRAGAGRRSSTSCNADRRCRSPSRCRTSRSTTAGRATCWPRAVSGSPRVAAMAQGAQAPRGRGLHGWSTSAAVAVRGWPTSSSWPSRARRADGRCASTTRARRLDVSELVALGAHGPSELYVCGPAPMLGRHQGGAGHGRRAPPVGAAVRDLRQQRPVRTRRRSGVRIPRLGDGDDRVPATCRCWRRWKPAART